MNKSLPARIIALLLCLLMGTGPALAEGVRFTLNAQVDPEAYPTELQPLMAGISALLDISRAEGTLAYNGDSFALNSTLLTESDGRTCRIPLDLFGLDSHWGVRSALLGEQELMVNVASLLAFGQKASTWLGLPLDKAALLVPYTHEYALTNAWETLAPLFPAEEGTSRFTRAELDDIARALLTLCEEDAALYRWLEVTGLYQAVTQTIETFLDLPLLLVPGLRVTRTDNSLIWDVTFMNILTWHWDDDSSALSIHVPTKFSASAAASLKDGLFSASLLMETGADTRIEGSFLLPAALSARSDALSLQIDASMPSLGPDGYHFSLQGSIRDQELVIALPGEGADRLTLTAQLAPWEPEALPAYVPENLTGMNILSVNGDSLKELMAAIKRPLLSGLLDLLIVMPPQTVQTLMDALEDAGVIGLLTDALLGEAEEY